MRRSSERGVVIPLLAVISLGVIVALLVLGVNATRVKYAAADLRTEANKICKSLSESPLVSQRNVAATFAKKVNEYVPRLPWGVEIDGATVIVPTMTQDFITSNNNGLPFDFSPAGQDEDIVDPPHLTGLATNICSSGQTGFASDLEVCPPSSYCASSGRCTFQGDVYHSVIESPAPSVGSPQTMLQRYPASLLHNFASAGNTVICELRAKVGGLFFRPESQIVSARASFWQPAVGIPNSLPWDPPPVSPADPHYYYSPAPSHVPFPGLSVAVATEMTTNATDPRFSFTAPFDNQFNNSNPTRTGAGSFMGTSGAHLFAGGPDQVVASSAPASADEARVACMNPAVLVRNTYLSVLFEYLSRHGQFRTATELLHINPRARIVVGTNTSDDLPPFLSYPTLITEFGDDIAQEAFHLPYVFYYTHYYENGNALSVSGPSALGSVSFPAEFGVRAAEGSRLADGYLNPFASASAPPFGWSPGGADNGNGFTAGSLNYNSVLASQLRNCYHLYDWTGAPGSLGRFPAANPIDNTGYEPTNPYAYGNDINYRLTNGPYGGAEPWGQACPWGGSCSGFSRRLTAAEVLATLGTTQSCPFPVNNGTTGSGMAQDCSKPVPAGNPNSGSNDLRPDILAALAYMGNLTIGPIPTTGTAYTLIPAPAIAAPGLFPIQGVADRSAAFASPWADYQWTGLTHPLYPFGSTFYRTTKLTSSPILLVLHQRLSNPSGAPVCNSTNALTMGCGTPECGRNEVCTIRCLFESPTLLKAPNPLTGGVVARPVTVVYFPTNDLDNDLVAIDNMRCAFSAYTQAGDTTKGNVLFVYSPSDRAFKNAAGTNLCEAAGASGADCFRLYWHWLLTDAEHNIMETAKTHFLERFSAPGLKF